ncbi:MAG: hypothetical protein WAW11_00410 [Patescibacteria group bacterium]
MVYLITYDLNKTGQDYSGLYEAIKSIGDWWHYLDSNWLVRTDFNVTQISSILNKKIDQNDQLLIIRVMKDYDGWLPRDAWNWLNNINF